MRAYVGTRRRVLGVPLYGGLSGHVTLTGVFVWLLVVGVVELAVVALELAARLLKVVVVAAWAGADWVVNVFGRTGRRSPVG